MICNPPNFIRRRCSPAATPVVRPNFMEVSVYMRANFRFLVSALIATTMLLGLGAKAEAINRPSDTAAQTISINLVPDPPKNPIKEHAEKRNAAAKKVHAAAKKVLKKQGKIYKFRDVANKKRTIVVKKKEIYLDGKKIKIKLPPNPAAASGDVGTLGPISLTCKFKIAAALSAVLALGSVAIFWFIAPLAATTTVSLAGLTMKVAVWNTVATNIGAAGIVLSLLHDVLC